MSLHASTLLAAVAALLLAVLLVIDVRHRRGWPFAWHGLAAVFLWLLLADLRIGEPGPTTVALYTPGATTLTAQEASWRPGGQGDLLSPRELDHGRSEPSALQVHGYGLPAAVWRERSYGRIQHDPPPVPAGFPDVSWPQRVAPGELFSVSGRISGGAQQVRLQLGETTVAEVTTQDGHFHIEHRPALVGPVVFSLVAQTSAGTFTEPVATVVAAAEPLHVALQVGRPGFESRALKNWLQSIDAVGSYQVAIAPDVVRSESLGTVSDDQALDLLVVDAAELDRMAAAGRAEILDRVAREGTGLLVLAGSAAGTGPLAGFELAPAADTERQVIIGPGESLAVTAPALVASSLEPIVRDTMNGMLAGWRPHGRGRIAVVTASDTHRWLTAGHQQAFAGFWSDVIEAVLPPAPAPLWFEHAEHLPTAGLRSTVCRATAAPPIIAPTGLPLLQRTAGEAVGCHDWWPSVPGWNQIDGQAVYVYQTGDWQAWRAASRIEATAELAGRTGSPPSLLRQDLRGLWLGCFLACAIALWWMERRRAL